MGYSNFSLMLACTASYSFFSIIPQHWLKIWLESGQTDSSSFFMMVYVALCITAWISTSGIMW